MFANESTNLDGQRISLAKYQKIASIAEELVNFQRIRYKDEIIPNPYVILYLWYVCSDVRLLVTHACRYSKVLTMQELDVLGDHLRAVERNDPKYSPGEQALTRVELQTKIVKPLYKGKATTNTVRQSTGRMI